MNEEWAPIPGYSGLYEVSSAGRVRNVRSGRVLKPSNGRYRSVCLSCDGVIKRRDIHRLMGIAFLGEQEGYVRHLNDEKWDNRLENLAWGTPHENNMDTLRNGLNAMKNRTHCPQGHAYTDANTMVRSSGKHKVCRTCNRDRLAARDALVRLTRKFGVDQ